MADKKEPVYYCWTCGTTVKLMSTIYAYNENTGQPLIHTWRECPIANKRKWYFSSYHPVTKYEGLPYYPGL